MLSRLIVQSHPMISMTLAGRNIPKIPIRHQIIRQLKNDTERIPHRRTLKEKIVANAFSIGKGALIYSSTLAVGVLCANYGTNAVIPSLIILRFIPDRYIISITNALLLFVCPCGILYISNRDDILRLIDFLSKNVTKNVKIE